MTDVHTLAVGHLTSEWRNAQDIPVRYGALDDLWMMGYADKRLIDLGRRGTRAQFRRGTGQLLRG